MQVQKQVHSALVVPLPDGRLDGVHFGPMRPLGPIPVMVLGFLFFAAGAPADVVHIHDGNKVQGCLFAELLGGWFLGKEPVDQPPGHPTAAAFPGMLPGNDPDAKPLRFWRSGFGDAKGGDRSTFPGPTKLKLLDPRPLGSRLGQEPFRIRKPKRRPPGKIGFRTVDLLLIDDTVFQPLAGRSMLPGFAVQRKTGPIRFAPIAQSAGYFQTDQLTGLDAGNMNKPPACPAPVFMFGGPKPDQPPLRVDLFHQAGSVLKIASALELAGGRILCGRGLRRAECPGRTCARLGRWQPISPKPRSPGPQKSHPPDRPGNPSDYPVTRS